MVSGTVTTKEFTVGEYQKSQATGAFALILGYPLLDDADQLQAVVAASLISADPTTLQRRPNSPQDATVTAVDRNRTIIARYPDSERWLGQALPELRWLEPC